MRTRLFTLCAGFLLLGVHSVSAQTADLYYSTFSVNYDLIYQQLSDVSDVGAHFDGARTVKRDTPAVAIVGEAGVNHFARTTVSSVLGGGRLRIPIVDDRFLPFGQALIGLYHCGGCDDRNAFALQLGGGVDFRIPDTNFRLRAQLDVRHVFVKFVGFDAVRLAGGIVLPLSGR